MGILPKEEYPGHGRVSRFRRGPNLDQKLDQAAVRQWATRTIRSRLVGGLERLIPLRWAFLALLLRWTQEYSVLRENMKYTFVLAYGQLRENYLTLAKHLVEGGRLDAADDIFFLRAEEVTRLVSGGLEASAVRDLIDHRWRGGIVPPYHPASRRDGQPWR